MGPLLNVNSLLFFLFRVALAAGRGRGFGFVFLVISPVAAFAAVMQGIGVIFAFLLL